MPEVTFECRKVTPYRVTAKCPCGGELRYDPRDGALASSPPRYQHRCPDCGRVHNLRTKYPTIEHR